PEMLAENQERVANGYSQAHGPEQWKTFREAWEVNIGHNACIELFNRSYDD
ncbi:unnamed protein product, partial [marine sediment metagenome]